METLSGVAGPLGGGLGPERDEAEAFPGAGERLGPEGRISLSLVTVEAPKLPLPHVPLQALRNVSEITDRISKGSRD